MSDHIPKHIMAAVRRGHVREVTLSCDHCGRQHTGYYAGPDRAARVAAARRYAAENLAWLITEHNDSCPFCRKPPAWPNDCALCDWPRIQVDGQQGHSQHYYGGHINDDRKGWVEPSPQLRLERMKLRRIWEKAVTAR